jgi:hypothetical protein
MISVYNDHDIEVLNFRVDIDVFSISYCVDIEVPGPGFRVDIEDSSISYWFDIVCYNLRLGYRRFKLSDFKQSIRFDIESQTFDIDRTRHPSRNSESFSSSDLRYRRFHL